MKGSSWCDTGSEYSVPSISAGKVKVEGYWSYSEHWNRDEYHLLVLCYEVRIEVHKECEVITI